MFTVTTVVSTQGSTPTSLPHTPTKPSTMIIQSLQRSNIRFKCYLSFALSFIMSRVTKIGRKTNPCQYKSALTLIATSASQLPPPLAKLNLSQHPRCPASYPHLCIGRAVITQKVTHTLQDAATQTTYYEYLAHKFVGISAPATEIHWQLIRLALKQFKLSEQ